MSHEEFWKLAPGDKVQVSDVTHRLFGVVVTLTKKAVFSRYWNASVEGLAHDVQLWASDVLYVGPARGALKDPRFPHKCPRVGCGAPAYVGFSDLQCSKGCR